MKVITIEDANILIPNYEHKNFTATDLFIPKGTELTGEIKLINGLRKNQPFQYRLFYTENNQIIYINKTKPINMETTEVKLGIDATVVDIPKQTKDRNLLYGAIIGAITAYGYSAYKNKNATEKLINIAIGGLLGMVAGKIVTKTKGITIKK